MAELTMEQLQRVKGLGQSKIDRLVERFGSLEQVAEASAEDISSVPGVGKNTAQAIHAIARGEALPEPEPNGEKPKRVRKAVEARPKQARAPRTPKAETPVEAGDGENVLTDIRIENGKIVLHTGGKTQRLKLARPSLVLDLHDQTREAAKAYAESLQF